MSVLGMDPAQIPAPCQGAIQSARREAPSQGRGLRRSLPRACSTIRRWPSGSRRSASISNSKACFRASLISSSCSASRRRPAPPSSGTIMSSTRWPPDCRGRSSTASPSGRCRICHTPMNCCATSCRRPWRGSRSLTRCRPEAAAEWGKDGLVEIVVVSGFYQMFAAINQGFDIVPSGKGPPRATT